MKLIINETELNVLSAYAFEHSNGKRELRIEILQSEIEFSELRSLVRNNTGDIVLEKGDGSSEVFIGYTTTAAITDKWKDGNDIFEVVIDCIGEAERRASEAENRASEAEATANALAEIINGQAQEIESLQEENAMLTDCILEMSELIYAEPEAEELYDEYDEIEVEPVVEIEEVEDTETSDDEVEVNEEQDDEEV